MKNYSNRNFELALPKILTMIKVLGHNRDHFAWKSDISGDILWGGKHRYYFEIVLPKYDRAQLGRLSRRLRKKLGKFYL